MRLVASVLVLFFLTSSFAVLEIDEYSVIKVFGSIKHAKTDKALFTGDKVLSNEHLKFGANTSKAAVVNKEKGRFMLNSSSSGSVKEGLLPAMNNVASRAGALLNSLDFKNHFCDKYLVLKGYSVEIGSSVYPIDEQHFFFLRFNYNGEEISKKLSCKDSHLILDASEILKIDGKAISLKEGTNVSLIYRNNIAKTSETLAIFEPVFPNESDLKAECKLILSELEKLTAEEKKEHLLAYVTENYGKPNQENFNIWMKENLGI